eukprot:scaffold5408_cov129-Skeletonema_dohrnii-CCMP3373.AAC.4
MMNNIIFHLLILLLPASITSFSVSVYDNVIAPSTCQTLHTLTLQHTRRSHDGSSLFYRGPKVHSGQQQLTPIENALDSILRQLNDTSPMVEYWSRSQYINLDAHADIDENTLKDEGVLRCPRHGHVLYLQIANSDMNCDEQTGDDGSSGDAAAATTTTITEEEKQSRMGPTVVFNRKVAWGSVTPRTIQSAGSDNVGVASHNSPANLKERVQEYIVDVENYWDEETKRQYGLLENDNDDAQEKDEEKMAIVPAVNGRLLRFDGAAFHCVPKPPSRFLLSEDELTAFLEKDCEEDCEEDDDDYYWDDEDDDDDLEKEDLSQQRSVILFNTWPAGSFGPRGVLPDCVVEAVPDGIVLDDDDSASVENERISEQWKVWQDEYGPDSEKLHCNPADDWNLCTVDNLDGDETSDVTVPLMGNPTRRGCIQSKAAMQGQGSTKRIENAFYDGRRVSMTTLKE